MADESLATLRARAGHMVTIRWRDRESAAVRPPDFLRVEQRSELVWHAMLAGGVEPLIAWLAGRAIDDLSIGRPDLETLFHQYYVPAEGRS